MQVGFNAPTSGTLIEPDCLTRIITEGEALGFDYVTISDHIMVPRNLASKYPYTDTGEFPAGTQAAWLEQLTTTAYIAALTKKLRFVLSVMVVPHGPALRRTAKYAHGWYPVGTNPQFPMNTVGRFKTGLIRFRGFAEKAGRDPSEITIALRVLTGPGTRPRRSIEGEAELFTGSDAD